MALFDNERERSDSLSGDAATRALSVTVVENDFVERVYEKLANVYDLVFGPTLHPGRLEAIRKMNIQPGDSVLEVGVGTGINLPLYPSSCAITGIDLSTPMLEKARERIIEKGLAQLPRRRDGCRRDGRSRRVVRHRLRAVSHQRRARSGSGSRRKCAASAAAAGASSS